MLVAEWAAVPETTDGCAKALLPVQTLLNQ